MSEKNPADNDSSEGIELQQITTSVSRDLIDQNNERPGDERCSEIQRCVYPPDRPAAVRLARVRPRSLSEDLGSVSDTSLIISPGVPEEPCAFSEERPLEDGSSPTAFDLVQEHPGIDAANEEAQALDVERKLDEVLREGEYDLIEEKVTVKTLTSCKTNALLKAFEVNKTLRDLVEKAVNPETDEIETLSKSVNEFTYAFVDPLRSDRDTRNTFKSCLDSVVDKAIDTEQKKFVSHPVIHNLLNSRWYRSFASVRKKPWTSASRWGYLFLNIWPVFDIILFPFVFALFFVVHWIHMAVRKLRETEICFVVTLTNDVACIDETFDLVMRTIGYLIQKFGHYSANYSVILRDGNSNTSNINFEEVYPSGTALLNRVEALQKSDSSPRLYEDLCAARNAFKSPSVRKDSRKLLIVFTNDKIQMVQEDGNKDLHPIIAEFKQLGVHAVAVGIGEEAELPELRKIAGKNTTALHFGEFEAPKTIGKAIIQGVEGKDIFDHYLDYFTTPYFIFVRDSLSYLTLLGLHFDICLSPSTVAFSQLEWVILLFFLGRIVIEVDQFMSVKKAERKASRQRFKQGLSYAAYTTPDDYVQVVRTSSEENLTLKRLTNYFSDRWNMLDFIILVIYIATFSLRMFTWATSDTVSNNRPLAVAGYLYGFIALLLTLRVFGHVMECIRGMGAKLIAFFLIMWDVFAIFWQFLAMILAFSLAMTKIYVMEKSYISNKVSVEDLACGDEGFTCWWTMAKHLAWSCLGISDLEPLDSVDSPSMSLSYLLYSLFLIMVVILLVNMLIALLSNTYQRVEDNALREWSFKKAITIRAYSSYHPVPVPFNLVTIMVLGVWRLCQGGTRNQFDKTGFDERGRKAALDRLVERLEKTYFATYGYSFPLTDERKMDQLLHETDGSRRMANQIVQRVFRQQGCKQDKYIGEASAWESLGISIKGCLMTYEGPDFCHICKRREPKSIHGARYLMPFTRETPRIEVLIQESGERRNLALGAVFESYNCHWMPGWGTGTVGYHVDDGKIFEPGCDELGREVEDATAYRGDLIACEVDFDRATNETLPVVFFLNGREIARASMKRTAGRTNPFPFIAMGYKGTRVLAKMCPHDRGMTQLSDAPHPQHVTRDERIEQNLTHCAQQKYDKLREDMEKMERERRVQAMEFEEKLDKQWRMLLKIRDLVLLSLPERKTKESSDNNDVFS